MKKTKKKKRLTLVQRLRRNVRRLRAKVRDLTAQLDAKGREVQEVVRVNGFNAQAHRAAEVALARQNVELQAAEARLAGKPVHPELATPAGGTMALVVPARIPVPKPKRITP